MAANKPRTHLRAQSLVLSATGDARVDVAKCGKELPLYSPLLTAELVRATCPQCEAKANATPVSNGQGN